MNKSKGIKILLIEDDPMQRFMYKVEFEKFGFHFFEAENGEAGVELAKKEKPKLILIDMLLGSGITGKEVLTKLKKDPATKGITAIISSNFNKKGLKDECLKIGAADYILKSRYTPAEMIEKIKKYL
jgi:CheY-like chemotaxis protein